MNLSFNKTLAEGYTSKSQIARILTEKWLEDNVYCVNCDSTNLRAFENNRPVADYFCGTCHEEFELKSKVGTQISTKIVDGAYATMIDRITSNNNPNLFFMSYCNKAWKVNNLVIIPKHYFVTDIIEKRKPLSPTAKRAGWIGCNINLAKIPELGKIYLIKNSSCVVKNEVQQKWQQTYFLKSQSVEAKSWLIDIMCCIEKIPHNTFTLSQLYEFETYFQKMHPKNHYIKEKIRQQLQILRDKGVICFLGNGKYTKNTLV